MESLPFYTLPFIMDVMPFYGYADQGFDLMKVLNKTIRKMVYDNRFAFYRRMEKRKLSFSPINFEKKAELLEEDERWAKFKLSAILKGIPRDITALEKFIRAHHVVNEDGNVVYSVEFQFLRLVLRSELLEEANSLIETLVELKMINFGDPIIYPWLE